MDETVLKNLEKINSLRDARIKRIEGDVKREEKRLKNHLKERKRLAAELEAKTKDFKEHAAEYMKIEEAITEEVKAARAEINQLTNDFRTGKVKMTMEEFSGNTEKPGETQARIRKKHLSRLQEALSAVRDKDRLRVALEAKIAALDAAIERTRLELFDMWYKVQETTYKDYQRYRPGNMRAIGLQDLAAKKDAEFRVSQGGYPFHIQLKVESREALLRMPLDSRFLDKHLPDVYRIVEEHQNLDFDRKYLYINYLSVGGMHPEGINVVVKSRPGMPDEKGIITI